MKQKPWEIGQLNVSGRYLYTGKQPFFWLGDTAWLLFNRLDRGQIDHYLQNRADKGYTVIQAVAAMRVPAVNIYGKVAFHDLDMTRPVLEDDGYWDLIDHAFTKAEQLGLYIGLLPTWGGVVNKGVIGPDQASSYAGFLAGRYGARPNLIWINGGDTRGNENTAFWNNMGQALKALTPDKLVTFHPFGRTLSVDFFPDAPWIDFHMFQSGHRRYDQVSLNQWDDRHKDDPNYYWFGEDSWRYVDRAFTLLGSQAKPVLDAEPSYEQLPQGLHDKTQPRWQDHDVRRYAYWSMLAGACGFTYGHCDLMRMFRKAEVADPNEPGFDWSDAVAHPGSDSMTNMRRLFEKLPYPTGKAAQELLAVEEGERYNRLSVFQGDGFILAYTYTGRPIALCPNCLEGETLYAWWFNPASGVFNYAGAHPAGQILEKKPPVGLFANKDWVLLVKNQPCL
jgi:hypothetical protein